jgi:hypothetical protein
MKDKNIVMPLCKLGCDYLFEEGFILIDGKGKVLANLNKEITDNVTSTVQHYISGIERKICSHFNEITSVYFQHRYDTNSK